MIRMKLISLFLLFTSFYQVWTYESFNDFPLAINDGNYIIHATLTDLSSDKKYFIKEFIHSSTYKSGKISISSSDSSSQIDVHYGSSSKNQRLVLKDYDCDLFTYFLKWDNKISGVTQPLLNHILLVGPSLIYRLKEKSLAWQPADDVNVRGTTMHSSYAMIGSGSLKITYYYKDSLDSGISQPSRILFSGNDPSDTSSYLKENLVLDIYLQTQTDEELDKIILPRQGIGCPFYFSTDKNLNTIYFDIVRDSVHFISLETINGPTQSSIRNEIYADEENQLLNLKATNQGITVEAIYDYYLGLIYVRKSDGGCIVSPMGVNAPGLRPGFTYKPFRIDTLLGISTYDFRYLGETWFENRAGLKVDVWESIIYSGTIQSGKYDKIVTTIYTVDSANGDTSSGMTPVGQTIQAYNKDTKGSYVLIETTQKIYYEFGQQISDEMYESKFKIGDCYPNPSDKKTLAIKYACKEKDCDAVIAKYYYSFRDQIKTSILSTHVISSSRIGDIDVIINSNQIIAYVTFFNFPDLKNAFRQSYLYLSSDAFKGSSKSLAGSAVDCLKRNINMDSSFEALVYCSADEYCYRIDKLEKLVQDKQNGIGCSVYYTPLQNLYRYSREIPLSGMQTEMEGRELNFYVDYQTVKYKVSQVEEVKEPDGTSRELYSVENYGSKFVEDGSTTIMATNVNNLADCYRACANMDDDDCETFSYCEILDKIECLLSTSVYANVTDKRVYDQNCRIYRKNRLQDYIMIQNREFINPTSVATDYWTDDCADLCSQSDDCFSFQVCDGRCTFGGYYTDSSTKKSSNCQIYIPKLAHKYKTTGKVIVTETFHSEVNLDLDQCAALCYDLDADDGGCASFNYCPKSTASSSCQLSKYSVRDPSSQTIISDVCSNYETFSDEVNNVNKRKQNVNMEQEWKTGTTGKAAFGIIILFMAIGLLGGLIGFYVFDKSKSVISRRSSSSDNTFQWSRHTDVNDEQEQSNV